jgi:type I restriction enzyme M protein
MEELAEEHGGEDGLLADAKNDKDKLTKASVVARLKEIKSDRDAADERKVLGEYLALVEKDSEPAPNQGRPGDLITKFIAKYGKLTEDDIKTLVVDDKWLGQARRAWLRAPRRSE